MKVVTMRNGFIIVTLLALSGALSVVGSHGWFGTDAASAASPQEKTQARNDLNVVMASLRSVDTVPSPKLGQHNREIYGDWLGLSAAEFAALEQDGVI